ncbi:hypothetical protein HY357_02150, partial [Candidatus Roizmanbacteria bacterium]|nr:hypothetical protein [Candidatus Roizmanbacteria bacterium]
VAEALLFITSLIYYQTSFLHNIFLIFGILWLGPFFVQTRLMTVKRFLIISIFWFIYDIFFVWFTSSSRQILYTTKAIDFPLSVNFAKSSIGIADLFWAGFLLSLLKKRKIKLISIILLICSNLLLGIYAIYITHISVFPLLVIWVPIGIFFVFYENQNKGHLF